MAPRMADIEIEPELPLRGSVSEVLGLVDVLCKRLDHGNNVTRRDLYNRLDLIATELQQNPKWAASDRVINTFAATLEEYWRHLEAYNQMTIVERLLNCRMTYEKIKGVNDKVEEMIELLRLQKADTCIAQEEWTSQNEEEQLSILSFVTSAEVLDELRAVKAQNDHIVMLQAELDRIRLGESKLPSETHVAVERVYNSVANQRGVQRAVSVPAWFIPEGEVQFSEKKIGFGAFASVHNGTYGEHAHVVVKLLLPGTGTLDSQLQLSLRKEADLWFTFRHPHVVRMFGANDVATRPFIVMEGAKHGNMVEYLASSPANLKRRWQLLSEAAKGVAFLHKNNVAHGDLKLNNILISNANTALVADFGLSEIKNRSKSQSMTRRKDGEPILGGLRWMAPERFEKTPQIASDVYAFAMTILEAFLGEPPYASVKLDADVQKLILGRNLPNRPQGFPDDAWQLIQEMTVFEPQGRIEMSAVVPRLKALANHEIEENANHVMMCTKCYRRHPDDAKFCFICRIPVCEGSADLLFREISTTTLAEIPTRTLQKLYRLLAFSAPNSCPASTVRKLLAVAKDVSSPLSAVYAFGCLRILNDSPSIVVDREAFIEAKSALCTALRPTGWNDLVGADENQSDDELKQVELVDLISRLGAAPQVALRGRIPRIAELFRGSGDDPRVQSATLSALVMLTQGDEESLVELREESISARVITVLRDSTQENDKINAAIFLSGLTDSVLGALNHINAPDVRVLISALQDGDPELQQHVALVLANIARDEEGAKLIGLRGGVVPLVELMETEGNETLRCCALRALSQLVRYVANGTMFIEAGGINALQKYFERDIPAAGLKDSLSSLQQLVANSETLQFRLASNKAIVEACAKHLLEEAKTDTAKEQRRSAVEVLLELVKTHKPAIKEIAAIDSGKGFRRLTRLIEDGETLAGDVLVEAINTLLRGTAGKAANLDGAEPDAERGPLP